MKTSFGLFIAGALLAFAAGCTTSQPTPETRDLLLSSGFKVMTASTPAQSAHLKTLPPGKITTVNRNGKTWYIFPDAAHNRIYVGNRNQYKSFRQSYQDEQLTNGQVETANLREDSAGWNSWVFGDFGD